jgi:hypothetical protein
MVASNRFEIEARLCGWAEIDLTPIVQDDDFVEQLVDTLAGLVSVRMQMSGHRGMSVRQNTQKETKIVCPSTSVMIH